MGNSQHYFLRGIALTLLASSAVGGYAFAQKGVFMQPVSEWSSTGVQNRGNASYCAVARRFDGGVILTVARNQRDETSVALDFDAAQFTKDAVFKVSLDPGAGQQRSMTIKPTSQKAFVVKLGKDEPFYDALLRTGYLRSEIGEKSYSFNLSDIDGGKEKLTTCLSQIGETQTPVARVEPSYDEPSSQFADAPRAAAPDGKLQELSERLARLEDENTRLKEQPARVAASGLRSGDISSDPLKAEMTPELPLERLALKPLAVPAEEEIVADSKPVPAKAAVTAASDEKSLREVEALKAENKRLQQIATAAAKAVSVQSETRNEGKSDQSSVASLAAENRRLQAIIDAQVASVNVAEVENIDALNERLKTLEQENVTLSKRLESSQTELAIASTVPQPDEEDTALVAQLREENERLQKLEEENTTLAQKLQRLQTEFAVASTAPKPAQADMQLVADLQDENERLTSALASIQTAAGDEEPNEENAQLVAELKAENERLVSELAALQTAAGDDDTDTKDLERQLVKLESQNRILTERMDSLRGQNNSYSSTVAGYEARVEELENQLAAASKPAGPDYEAMVVALKTEIEEMQAENIALKQKDVGPDPVLEAEISTLKTENELLNLEISRQSELAKAEYEGKLAAMKVENEKLEERLAAYLGSEDSIAALKDEMQGLKTEKDKLSLVMADIEEKTGKMAVLEGVLQQLERENALLKEAALAQESVAHVSLDEKAAEAEAALSLAEYEEKLETLTLENEGMRGELEKAALLSEEVLAGQEKLQITEEKLQVALADLEVLKEANTELAEYEEKLETLTLENEGMRGELEKAALLKEEVLAVREKLEIAQADLETLKETNTELAEYEEKLETLTLENEGMRGELEKAALLNEEVLAVQEKLEIAQADLGALKEANTELAAILDEVDDIEIPAVQEEQEVAEGVVIADLEAEIKTLGEENKALKDELGMAQIELISLQQNVGKVVSEELEQALGGVSGQSEDLEEAEAEVEDTVADAAALDITEEKTGDSPLNVDDIAQDLSFDPRPLEQVKAERDVAVESDDLEIAEVIAEQVKPARQVQKAPLPYVKPARKVAVAKAQKPDAEATNVAAAAADAESIAAIEPAAGADVDAERLLAIQEQEAHEAGLSEAQRHEMMLAREMGGAGESDPVVEPAIEEETLAERPDSVGDAPEAFASISDDGEVIETEAATPVLAKVDFEPSLPIEKILTAARIPVSGTVKMLGDVSTPQFYAYQWKSENGLFGSAQQKPIQGEAQFDGLVQDYLTKTEERCRGDFAISPSSTQEAGGTRIDSYEIACVGGGVDSSASLLFFNQGGTFTVVAHESPTEGMNSAMDYRDRLIESLKKS